MEQEVQRRLENLLVGIGKNAAKVSDVVSKVMPELKEEPAEKCETVHMQSDKRCTAHGLHKIVDKKTF